MRRPAAIFIFFIIFIASGCATFKHSKTSQSTIDSSSTSLYKQSIQQMEHIAASIPLDYIKSVQLPSGATITFKPHVGMPGQQNSSDSREFVARSDSNDRSQPVSSEGFLRLGYNSSFQVTDSSHSHVNKSQDIKERSSKSLTTGAPINWTWVWIAIGIVVVLVVGALVRYFWQSLPFVG